MVSTPYGFGRGQMGIAPIPSSFLPRAYDTGSISPSAVAKFTSAEQTFTVTGLATRDAVTVNKPTAQAGLGIVGARVTAQDTLGITFVNATSASITPTATEVYKVVAIRAG